ncbi:MAG: DNA repair protein RadA [Actinobacteria bacterium]|nr:DNA repair protein RadA [Actinomycetota bacterium]
MTRTRVRHSCTDCGAQTPRWLGRCPECGAWNTLVEEIAVPMARAASTTMPTAVSINLIDPIGAQRRATGVPELDRVLDGGLVPGSVTLLVGEPGMGKSTLMLQALGRMAADGARCLLVSAEESCEQVRMRADRLGVLEPSLLVVSDTSLHNVLAQVDAVAPDVLAIDSIQTVHDPELPGSPGSVTQVRECAQRLVRLAKERGISVVLVGHVTKDGQLAGPRALEHVVDTVLQFEGDRHHALRMLRALKHRFGSTHELGLFEMGEVGLIDVPDPSALFLTDRRAGLPGSIVAPVLEGARPLLVEVQALVNSSTAPMPRRSAQGLESSRLAMLLAVLDARAGVSVADVDVYASVAGGVRVIEAGADLAVAIAVASARIGVAVPDDLVAIGEIGLGGELRQAGQTPRRLAEAARLGFRRAIVPASSAGVEGIELIRVGSVVEALAAVGLSLDQQRAPS